MDINAKQYLDQLTANGEIAFSAQKMRADMGGTTKAAERAIARLKHKQEIAAIAKGYYLILTPEFRKLGCLPPDYFIDSLMQYWQQDYYVGLLSAGLYLGAAHQQPQIFQVVTGKYQRNIHCGHVNVEFITKKNILNTFTTELKTKTGIMKVSTPEATMMDLCIFLRRSGGLSHAATVIDELADSVEFTTLQQLLQKNNELAWVQRLGFILEYLEHSSLSELLYQHIKHQKMYSVPLVPYRPMVGCERNKKWHIVINATLESDIHDSN